MLRSVLACLLFSSVALADNLPAVPAPNRVSEEDFHHILALGEQMYAPYAVERGEILKMDADWSSSKTKAKGWREVDRRSRKLTVSIEVHGGIARRAEIDRQGFMLILCHEFGHVYGGEPYGYERREQISSEGQADYFAAHSCLGEMMKRDGVSVDHVEYDNPFAVQRQGRFVMHG